MKSAHVLWLAAFCVVAVLATTGRADLADDAMTVALWHMENTGADDDCFNPDRNHDLSFPARAGFTLPTYTTGGGGYDGVGEALDFDGFGVCQATNFWTEGDTSVKLDLWMNVTVMPGDAGTHSNGYIAICNGNFQLYLSGSTLIWRIYNSSNASVGIIQTSISGREGEWLHIEADYNGDTLDMNMAINGVNANATATDVMWARETRLYLGGWADKDAERGFYGKIDEVKVSKGDLDVSAPTDDCEAVAVWHFDVDGSDDDSASPGRDNDVTLGAYGRPAPVITSGGQGIVGEALEFDGASLAYAPSGWDSYSTVTVDFWMNIAALPGASEDNTAYIMYASSTWDLYIAGGNKLVWKIYGPDSNATAGTCLYTINECAVGTWMHVVAELDADLNMSLTVNEGTPITSVATATMWERGTVSIHIGGRVDKPVGRSFNGMLDEVKISAAGIGDPTTPPVDNFKTVALWQGDDDGADFAWYTDDDSDNPGRDATLSPRTGYDEPNSTGMTGGYFDGALDFNGMGYAAGLSAFGSPESWKSHESVKLDFWMNLRSLPDPAAPESNTNYILRASGCWELYITGTKLRWRIYDFSTTLGYDDIGLTAADLNKWMHVTVEYTGWDEEDPNSNVDNMRMTVSIPETCDVRKATHATTGPMALRNVRIEVGGMAGKPPERGIDGLLDAIWITEPGKSEIKPCGFWGYHPVDFNRDCIVDLTDLSMWLQDWLACTDPDGVGCTRQGI